LYVRFYYNALLKQNYTTIVKACVVDIKKDFYEVVTPKAPVEVSCKLKRVGNTSFTTVVELYCGGKMKPSVALRKPLLQLNSSYQTLARCLVVLQNNKIFFIVVLFIFPGCHGRDLHLIYQSNQYLSKPFPHHH
jgi:hypothetical protein